MIGTDVTTAAVSPWSGQMAAPTSVRTEVVDVFRASAALRELVRARTQLHRLQRAMVLGYGDDGLLDAAVATYRHARARAADWLAPLDSDSPSPDELFAGWLVEAAVGRELPAA